VPQTINRVKVLFPNLEKYPRSSGEMRWIDGCDSQQLTAKNAGIAKRYQEFSRKPGMKGEFIMRFTSGRVNRLIGDGNYSSGYSGVPQGVFTSARYNGTETYN